MVGTDLLVLDAGAVTAIDLATLTVHWRSPAVPDGGFALGCGPSICVFADEQTVLLDPATGAVRAVRPWSYPATLADGRILISTGERMVLVDTSLRELPVAAGWTLAGGDEHVIVAHPGRRTGERWLGMLDRNGRVLLLGRVPVTTLEVCSEEGRYLVCRSEHGIVALDLGRDALPDQVVGMRVPRVDHERALTASPAGSRD